MVRSAITETAEKLPKSCLCTWGDGEGGLEQMEYMLASAPHCIDPGGTNLVAVHVNGASSHCAN